MEKGFVETRLEQLTSTLLFSSGDEDGDNYKEELLRPLKEIEDAASGLEDQTVAEAAKLLRDLFESTENPCDLEDLLDDLFEIMKGEDEDRASIKTKLGRARTRFNDLQGSTSEAEEGGKVEIDPEFREEIIRRINEIEQTVLNEKPGVNSMALSDLLREFHTLKGEAGILGLSALQNFCHSFETELTPFRGKKGTWKDDIAESILLSLDACRVLLDSQPAETKVPVEKLKAALGKEKPGEETEPVPAMDLNRRELDRIINSSVQISPKKIELLLMLASEILIVGETFSDNVTKLSAISPNLGEAVSQLLINGSSLHEVIASLQMAPIEPLFARLRRSAFDAAKSCGKKIDFVTKGGDTEIDRSILEVLFPPMLHIIRNSVDHGIGSPSERRETGKTEHGKITVSAYRDGKNVMVAISDDGQGINNEKIRKKAIQMGILRENEESNNEKLQDLIFNAGFSTAKRVTNVSGRGMGLDIVTSSIKKIGGDLKLTNKPGEGVVFTFSIPLSTASIEGLIIVVGGLRFMLPVHSVRETRTFKKTDITYVQGKKEVIKIRNVILPLVRLSNLFQVEPTGGNGINPDNELIVVVESGDSLAAFVVDEVERTRRVIVGPLPANLKSLRFFSGAVTMANREVVLVINPGMIIPKDETIGRKKAYEEEEKINNDRIETVKIGGNQVGMIDFFLAWDKDGKEEHIRFAINAFKVREFVSAAPLISLPVEREGFLGMLDLRGTLIPVIDFASVAGYSWKKDIKRDIIIICEFTERIVGVLVSSVNRVNYMSWNDIKPLPKGGGIRCAYTVGTLFLEGDITFLVDFENVVADVLPRSVSFNLASNMGESKKGARILLVEDSNLIRRKSKEALIEAGIEVIEAENGKKALDKIQSISKQSRQQNKDIFNYLDLVLSDIEMPQMDGYTLTYHIKNDPVLCVLPVILHSSLTNETIVKRAREVKADGFVAKSQPAELVEALQKYL